jgi:hypothetical protein
MTVKEGVVMWMMDVWQLSMENLIWSERAYVTLVSFTYNVELV